MIHWCADETALLIAGISSLPLLRSTVRARVAAFFAKKSETSPTVVEPCHCESHENNEFADFDARLQRHREESGEPDVDIQPQPRVDAI